MRKIAAFCTLLMAAVVGTASAQEKKEAPKSPPATANNSFAEVSYSQPSKRGRVIFGELVPYGEIWRTGANMSTDITFKSDVEFAGKTVKKGSYAIFTIPEKDEWTVILNSQTKQRGASEYEQHKDKNVVEVKVPVTHTTSVQEQFLISFDKDNLIFTWDQTKVKVPLKKK
jgi:hypothetical protein